jgi:dTDP-glucose 4,6-dehydratase
MRVIVLGAAGFIGSHLCDFYLSTGHQVIGIDDFSSGRTENLNTAFKNSNFSFIERDICEGFPNLPPIDLVLNFASLASPDKYSKRAIHTLRTGSIGTENALKLATEHGSRFVMASTSEVYGDPLEHPQKESYRGNVSTTGPRSMYDEAKRFSEALCAAYLNEKKCDVGVVRIFNTYGPRLSPSDGRVISNFLSQSIQGMPVTIYGDGSQTRSFCFVDDLVQGIVSLATTSHFGPINLGNPNEFSILQLVDSLEVVLGREVPRVFLPIPGDDPVRRRPDISQANKLLHWSPKTDLKQGLQITLSWFRDEEFSPR